MHPLPDKEDGYRPARLFLLLCRVLLQCVTFSLHWVINRPFSNYGILHGSVSGFHDALLLRIRKGKFWNLKHAPPRSSHIDFVKLCKPYYMGHLWQRNDVGNRQKCTACGHRIAHRKWKETKLQPGTAGPGSMLGWCLISFHFLWGKLTTRTVQC